MRVTLRSVLGAAGMLAAACTGAIEPGPAGASQQPRPPGAAAPASVSAPPSVESACQGPRDPGPAPLRRLTRFEYNNVVRDLLGDATRPADAFPAEEEAAGFDNDAGSLTAPRLLIEQYLAAADAIAARAVADLPRLLGCDPARAGEQACGQQFVDTFGARAFRRPLEKDERSRLLAILAADAAEDDFATRVRTLVATVLQLPQFLYRDERGPALDPHAMASRLSLLFWGTMPDEALFAAARAGALARPEQVLAQARRLLADPRAKEVVRRFHGFALGLRGEAKLEKDARLFPAFSAELAPLFARETELFLDDLVFEGAPLGQMFTAAHTWVDARLARYYGVLAPSGAAFARVAISGRQSAGFLTHGGQMAKLAKPDRTDPIQRGLFVRGTLLCDPPPDPPADATAGEKNIDPRLPARERLAVHRAEPACAGCHTLIDPIGFGFEAFDAAGRWRTTENGRPIDARGELQGTDIPGAFDGAAELGARLASSAMVRRCYAAKWFQYAYGRTEMEADRCSRARLDAALSTGSVKDLLLALAQTDAFLLRRP